MQGKKYWEILVNCFYGYSYIESSTDTECTDIEYIYKNDLDIKCKHTGQSELIYYYESAAFAKKVVNNQSLIVALNHSREFKNPLPHKEIIKHARKKIQNNNKW